MRRLVNIESGAQPNTGACATSSHLLRVILPNLFQSLLQVLLILLLQSRVARTAVDITRFILALIEFLAGPLIVNMRCVGLVYNFFHQFRRDKRDAFTIADSDV